MKKPRYANIILLVAVVGLLFVLFRTNFPAQTSSAKYSQVVALFEEGKIQSFTLDVGNGNLENASA